MHIVTFLVAAILVLAQGHPAAAQRSPVIDFRDTDAEMNAAIAKARTTLPTFWHSFEKPGKGEDAFALKVRFPVGGPNNAEHIWVGAIERLPNGRFAGRLANVPRDIKGRIGDRVEFGPEQISDWMFTRNGKMVGAETLRPMLKRMPKAEADALRARMERP